jgi:hypothetical protein
VIERVYVKTDAGDVRELLLTGLGWLDSMGGTWIRDGKAWKRAERWSSGRAEEVRSPFPKEAPKGARRVA